MIEVNSKLKQALELIIGANCNHLKCSKGSAAELARIVNNSTFLLKEKNFIEKRG